MSTRLKACSALPSGQFEPAIGGDTDVKEQFFVHTYNTLVDFIKDFQTDRTLTKVSTWTVIVHKLQIKMHPPRPKQKRRLPRRPHKMLASRSVRRNF